MMGKAFKLQGEFIFHLLLILLGFFIILISLQLGFGTLKQPGSGLFPFLCGMILFFLNLLLFFFRREAQDQEPVFADAGEFKKYLGLILVLVSWILVMPLLGWPWVTFLVTFFLAKILRLEGWTKPLLLAAGNTALTYFLFGYCLVLDLPQGFWG